MNAPSIAAMRAPAALPMRINFAWMFAGNAVGAFGQWALVVILARLSDAATLGSYSLVLAITSPLFLLFNLQLRCLYATDMAGEHAFRTYFCLRIWTTLLATCLLAASIPFLASGVAEVLMAMAFAKAFEAISEIVYAAFQREGRMDRIGQSMLIRAGLMVAAMSTLLGLGAPLAVAVWAGAVASLLVTCRDWRGLSTALRPAWHAVVEFPALSRLARQAGVLSFSLLFVSLNANLPRYQLAHSFGDRAVGLFSALAYLSIAGNTLIMALGQAAVPSLARSFFRRDGRSFLGTAQRLLGLAIAAGVGGLMVTAVFGEALLGLLYGPEYAGQKDAFLWIMAAGGTSYVAAALGYLLGGARRFHSEVWILLAATLSTAGACSVLIPKHGLEGAAWAQLIGCSIQIAASVVILGTTCRKQFSGQRREASC